MLIFWENMYKRILKLDNLLKMRSFFLFGPRGVGKSTLIRQTLPLAKVYDLLNPVQFQRLMRNPGLIAEESKKDDIVVIDEIQKMPSLLDEVHRLIFERGQCFLLTGSSARKLKRGGANLLAGRAFSASLFPLSFNEIDDFNLLSYLNTTALPEFYGQDLAKEFLSAYVGTYLKEEIQAESLTRNLQAFSRFLEIMALNNGQELNYASLSSDTGIQAKTIENYISILNDTLIGFHVNAFLHTKKRKAITRSKYYLFDVGVVNNLTKRGIIEVKSELFGRAFEHFLALELRAWLSYNRIDLELSYWRSTSMFEVDFILGNILALEIKSTDLVSQKHLKGLKKLKEEEMVKYYAVISLDNNIRRMEDGINIFPWRDFLINLWRSKSINELTIWLENPI